jgi:ADP-heptose:LPS heptosyltransferase
VSAIVVGHVGLNISAGERVRDGISHVRNALMIIWDRLRRLFGKSSDLYRTSRSPLRVAQYNLKYVNKFLRLVWDHVTARRHARGPAAIGSGGSCGIPVSVQTLGGGLGDLLITANYLRDLEAYCGDLSFDVYCADLEWGSWALQHLPGLRHCYGPLAVPANNSVYALTLQIGQYPIVDETSTDMVVVESNPRLKAVVSRLRAFASQHEIEISRRPFLDAYIAQKAVYSNKTRADFLQHVSGIPVSGRQISLACDDGMEAKLGLTAKPFVTVHSGFDPNFIISTRSATKCYPYFDAVVALLKVRNPGLQVVQVGARNSQKIEGCHLDLRGCTDLPEVAGLLCKSLLHIDNEGGLVHVAAQLGTRSCVIFGPTPVDDFGYADNLNIRPPVCGGCWWINDSWMDQCPRGFSVPPCMERQPPGPIADKINEFLQDGRSPTARNPMSCTPASGNLWT